MMRKKIRSLIQGLFRRSQVENDMADELRFHIDARIKDLIARGARAGDAQRQARREFGSVEKYKDEMRQARGLRLFDELGGDLRYAVRRAGANPGFALTIIITLALGIGLNTAIFSLVEALLLRPLAVSHPEQIVAIYTSDFSSGLYGASAYPDYQDFRARTQTLAGLSAYRGMQLLLSADSGSQLIFAELVTGNYFPMLGAGAARGRLLTEPDDTANAAPAAVISYALWNRRFNADPQIVGRQVQLNGKPFTIVGVAAHDYSGASRPLAIDAWLPLAAMSALAPESTAMANRGSRSFLVVGRLREGVTREQAQAEFDLIAAQQFETYPQDWVNIQNAGRTISLVPERGNRLPPEFGGPVSGFMAVLMALVGLVLLTACANVANLLLARGSTRGREIGVRLALGCSRARLLRQLLTENTVLALAGGALGLLPAVWLMRILASFEPPLPRSIVVDLQLNGSVLIFTLVISLATGIVFGLMPAFHAVRTDILPVVKVATVAGRPRQSRLRSVFVVAQVACSIVLLIGAALFIRSLQRAGSIDVGFNPSNMIVMSLNPRLQGYDETRGRALYESLVERLRAMGNVQSASFATTVPLNLMGSRRGTVIEGYQPRRGEDTETAYNVVAPQYFDTMQIPIVRGRPFSEDDGPGAPPVIIVNDAFARRYWPGEDPLGKRVSANGPRGPFREVIGVTRTGKYNTLGEDPRPYYYVPLWQEYRFPVTLHVKTAGDPSAALASVREAVRSVDASIPVFDVKTMDDQMRAPLLPAQLAGSLLGGFGALALLLASIGIYGVMAYSVAQRTREIGVRVALGAQKGDLLRLVFSNAAKLIAIGLTIGVSIAAVLTRLVGFLLYGITPADPIAFTGAIAVLVGTALLACYIPARRAMRVDPVTALRSE